jgi:hypothetical protein
VQYRGKEVIKTTRKVQVGPGKEGLRLSRRVKLKSGQERNDGGWPGREWDGGQEWKDGG